MQKWIKILVLLIIAAFSVQLVNSESTDEMTQYNHFYTLVAPIPSNHAWFGQGVSIEGERIVVNEEYGDIPDYRDAGKAYLYDLDGTLIATLQSPTPGEEDGFGFVDLTEELLVASDLSMVSGVEWAGRVHVFTNSGDHLFSLEPPHPTIYARFGRSAQISDNILVISEIGAETDPGMAGLVHIYDMEGVYIGNISSPNPIVAGRFGCEIEITEEYILVSEYGQQSSQGPQGPGKVYVYDHDLNFLRTIQASEPEEQACFGSSMSVSDDYIVIGEPFATVDDTFRAGKAYLYNMEGEHLQTFVSPITKLNGRFGDSVAIDGDVIVIGEWDAHVNPGQYEGRAYVYDIEGNLLQNLTAPDPFPRAAFGIDLDIQGDMIVVGESWAGSGELGQVGRVHVYKLGASVEVQELVEETASETEENETEKEGGIPGFPVLSIGVSLLVLSLFLRKENIMKRL